MFERPEDNLKEAAFQEGWKKYAPSMITRPADEFEQRLRPSREGLKHEDVRETLMPATKETNPKDAAGSARIDPTLVSAFAIAECALAMEEGSAKYGAFNYTVVGVKSRVYVAAAMRHLWKFLLGEDRDPKTGVHHLGSVMACAAIVIDAQVRSKLVDDRPPSHKDASAQLDSMEARVKRVREVFKDYSPRHYTIEDTQHGTGEQIHPAGAQAPT